MTTSTTRPADAQRMRDDGDAGIGWCWSDGDVLVAVDDRWGVESRHEGGIMLRVAMAMRSVKARCMAKTIVEAQQSEALLRMGDELRDILTKCEGDLLPPDELERLRVKYRVVMAQFDAMGGKAARS